MTDRSRATRRQGSQQSVRDDAQPMTEDARSAGALSSMSKGAKWLGPIVVVALVGALVPLMVDRWSGPDELGAKLDKVTIPRIVKDRRHPLGAADQRRRRRGSTRPGGP